ncbi:MAG TPA: glycosyltransferase [Desulfoprunum sp.]|nr:glycosyltransferase [Desulfoprunum sp.]
MTAHKILYILPQPFLLSRGSSFRALATVNALAELGYRVDLLCYPLGIDPKKKRYEIHRSLRPPLLTSVKIGPSPQKVIFDIPLACAAHRMVRRNGYAVIHGVEEAGFIAAWLGKKFGVPYVYDMHSWMSQQIEDGNYLPFAPLLELFRKMESRAMQRAQAIITVGPEMTEILRTKLAPGVYAATLPDCPLVFDDLDTGDPRQRITQEFFAVPRKVILYTGNFHPYQGIDLLLEGIRELKNLVAGRFPFALLLVGGGEGEAKSVAAYRQKVEDLGIAEEVVFCGAHPAEAMPIFMDGADLLVSSRSTGNNVPLKIYTYLASGRLLVATDIPSHTQVLNAGNCLLADPDPASLARTLYRGLAETSDEERQRLTTEARRIGGDEQHRIFSGVLRDCYAHCTS